MLQGGHTKTRPCSSDQSLLQEGNANTSLSLHGCVTPAVSDKTPVCDAIRGPASCTLCPREPRRIQALPTLSLP